MREAFAFMFDADDELLGAESIGSQLGDWSEDRFKSWAEAIMSTFLHFDPRVVAVGLYYRDGDGYVFQDVSVER